MPSSNGTYHLYTDASKTGIGAMLFQECEGNSESRALVAVGSKAWRGAEVNWSTTEQEAYAVVWALEKYKKFIWGLPIHLYTDHKALLALDQTNNGKLARWRMRLAGFDLQMEHLAGINNIGADWLSRMGEEYDEGIDRVSVPICEVQTVNAEAFQDLLREEPEIVDKDKVWRTNEGYHRVKGSNALYIPSPVRSSILFILHGSPHSGHAGFNRCLRRARGAVWWGNMYADLRAHIQNCMLCFMNRPIGKGKAVGSLNTLILNQIVSLDYVVFDKEQGGKALIIIDHATRMMMGVMVDQATSEAAQDVVLNRWIPQFGYPGTILTDNHPFQTLNKLTKLVIQHWHTSTFYPEGNAVNESSHRFVRHAVALGYLEGGSLEEVLATAVTAHNAYPHEGLGCSPYEAVFGMEPTLPGIPPRQARKDSDRHGVLKAGLIHRMLGAALQKVGTLEAVERQLQVGDIVTYELSPLDQRLSPFYR